jgi:MFS transporter, DHA1 family, tetracycline resistance protein
MVFKIGRELELSLARVKQGEIMSSQQTGNRALLFVAFICFIDMCGIGLIIPVIPSLIKGLTGKGIDDAAEIGGWLLFTYAIMQFLCAPIIGGLSDRFGRRPVLLGTLVVLGFDYALMAFAPTLNWLFVGRAVSGVMGATWAAANACIADTTTPETRGRAYGLLGAGGAAGFVIGPAIGGLLGLFGDRAPFVAAAVMALGGAAFGSRYLKETLPPERRRAFDWSRANPLGTLIQMAKIPLVFGFLAVIFAMQLGSQVTNAVWSFYNILKFDWSPMMIGVSAAVFGIAIGIVQGLLTGKAIARFGEARTGVFSLCFAVPAYLIFAFASAGWAMFVGILFGALGNACFPAMQAMMTHKVPQNAQGELQGAIASMISLTAIIGPVMMASVFGHFADKAGVYFPGAPFIVAAFCLLISVLLFARNVQRHWHGWDVPENARNAEH